MKRRDFLKLGMASLLLSACEKWPGRKIGLALGGGGARGLAHVQMLQVFDELKLRPYSIAGTSIGAIIGALYASGMTAQAIRDVLDRLTVSRNESWLGSLFEEDVGRWWDIIKIQIGRGGLVSSEGLVGFLRELIKADRFEELQIPLKVVATDFWERQQVVFSRGPLFPALQASIAIPGLFSPIEHQGRVLVDGGLVNPVPYDLLFRECDVVVAIDVLGNRTPMQGRQPGYLENSFNALQIMQASIVREKLKSRPPDIYLYPDLKDIHVLDFHRFDEIHEQALPAQKKLRKSLRRYRV